MSNGLAEFMAQFRFDRNRKLFIGVERERFLTRSGEFVPESAAVMREIATRYPKDKENFAFEFSACVLENRTQPCGSLEEVRLELQRQEDVVADVLGRLGLQFTFKEVAPTTIPFVINESKNERYRNLFDTLPLPAALAACRIIGTHVHIGMPDHESALRAYNRLVTYWRALWQVSTGSGDRRLRLYSLVKDGYIPSPYSSWQHFYEDACKRGFAENPKDDWAVVRMTAYGTIETKVFGATAHVESICRWAETCQWLCATELNAEDILTRRLLDQFRSGTLGEDV